MRVKRQVGDRFGKLVLVKRIYGSIWLADCDCGVGGRRVHMSNLSSGRTTSCGCVMRTTQLRHGEARDGHATSEYCVWRHIIERCTNQKHPRFADYGGRGIKVCDRWHESFVDFIADVGRKPSPQHSIDRIDNDGNYEPGNVRWATRKEQQRNTRRSQRVEFDGCTLTVREWAERLGLSFEALRGRLRRGWAFERAIHGGKTTRP